MLANPKWLICFDLWPLGTLKALEGQRPPETREVTISERAKTASRGHRQASLFPWLDNGQLMDRQMYWRSLTHTK